MKIVHLSVCRQFSRGQLNQLRYEYNAAKLLGDVEWTTLGYHVGASTDPFIKSIPFPFKFLFLRNLYGWLVALRLSKSYDRVLMRHMTFDPFAFIFAPLISNRVSVHHAKEIEELKIIKREWRGKFASFIECYCGKVAVRNTQTILGVTKEIAEYERELHCPSKNTGVYPNGIEVNAHKLLPDLRISNEVHAAFICGTFSSWHGLDRLIQAIEKKSTERDGFPVYIHLIGNLSKEQINEIGANQRLREIFLVYGVMSPDDYRLILEKCDYGIGSLAMDRQNLTEGSTLKVREMLALGLPVYSGHSDVALPSDAPWVKIVNQVNLSDLREFGLSVKNIQRTTVREQSRRMIEKLEIMKKTVQTLKNY